MNMLIKTFVSGLFCITITACNLTGKSIYNANGTINSNKGDMQVEAVMQQCDGLEIKQARQCNQQCRHIKDAFTRFSSSANSRKQRNISRYSNELSTAIQSCQTFWGQTPPPQLSPFIQLANNLNQGKLPKAPQPMKNNKAGQFGTFKNNNNRYTMPQPLFDKQADPAFLLAGMQRDIGVIINSCHLSRAKDCRQVCKNLYIHVDTFYKSVEQDPQKDNVKRLAQEQKSLLNQCYQRLNYPRSNSAQSLTAKNQLFLSDTNIFQQWKQNSIAQINQTLDSTPFQYLTHIENNHQVAIRYCNNAQNTMGINPACSNNCKNINVWTNGLRQMSRDQVDSSEFKNRAKKLSKILTECNQYWNRAEINQSIEIANHIAKNPQLFVNKQGIYPQYQQANISYTVKPLAEKFNLDLPASLKAKSTSFKGTPYWNSNINNYDFTRSSTTSDALKNQCPSYNQEKCFYPCKNIGMYAHAVHQYSTQEHFQKFIQTTSLCFESLGDKALQAPYIDELLAFRNQILLNNRTKSNKEPLGQAIAALSAYRDSCASSDSSACYFQCANAVSTLSALSKQRGYTPAHFETLTHDYIQACLSLNQSEVLDNLITPIKKALAAAAYSTKTANYRANYNFPFPRLFSNVTTYNDSEFIGFKHDQSAPFINSAELAKFKIAPTLSRENAYKALFTLDNYCPESAKNCCKIPEKHPAIISLDVIYNPQSTAQSKRAAASHFVNYTMRMSDNPIIVKETKITPCLMQWQQLPKATTPVEVKQLSQLVENLRASQPSLGSSGLPRKYCVPEAKNKQNPFYDKAGCEYLSALYYGDFENVAKLELLVAEPIMNHPHSGPFLSAIFKGPKNYSYSGALVTSYLLDYQSKYKQCIQAGAKQYAFTNTTITEYRNRWGRNLRTEVNSTNNQYVINADWIPYYEKMDIQLSGAGVKMSDGLDKLLYSNSTYTQMLEYTFGEDRPNLGDLMSGISNFMSHHSCDSPQAKQLDNQMKRFLDFRRSTQNNVF